MRRLSSANSGQLQPLSAVVERIRYKAYKTVSGQHGDAYVFPGGIHHNARDYTEPSTHESLAQAEVWVLMLPPCSHPGFYQFYLTQFTAPHTWRQDCDSILFPEKRCQNLGRQLVPCGMLHTT
ncbi:hypothetical protein PHLCEN_2v7647 [Hermanssonia centrifuga]|uniref:Uncharacterized protein n=1 Tax=Hermanssonia centrifuga TaxID=98765 RepID=A0A2R6NVZ6_9APHY|nr:hypothetical protein PHLCEN_2v7647 [Hermanssonia centrifuga]